jgi:hypothetical protein
MQYPPTKIFLENTKKREKITKMRERGERKKEEYIRKKKDIGNYSVA